MGMARGGKVRILALASTRPTALAPELPLLTKDIPALDINNWFGLVGPAKLPADIQKKLHAAAVEALKDPALKARMAMWRQHVDMRGVQELAAAACRCRSNTPT